MHSLVSFSGFQELQITVLFLFLFPVFPSLLAPWQQQRKLMRKVCDVPTDPHPFSLSVLGKQCQKHWHCSREKGVWEGNDLSRWIFQWSWRKGRLLAKSNHQKYVFSFCSISGEPKVPSITGREWGEVLLEQGWLWIHHCASSLFLLSFNLQPMKKANIMMVAQCCLRTTKSSF